MKQKYNTEDWTIFHICYHCNKKIWFGKKIWEPLDNDYYDWAIFHKKCYAFEVQNE